MLRFFTSELRSGRRWTRREWLRIGGLAGLGAAAGLTPGALAAASNAGRRTPGFGRAKSVLLVYTSGGQSQLETWDPKPEAPEGIRGEFRPIATAVPGTFVGEHMPRLAALADRYTIVRSLSHDDLDHGSATYLALTGRFYPKKSSNPPPKPTDFPNLGAVLKRVRPNGRFPYDAINVNGPAYVPLVIAPGQDGGFLGREYEPLVLGDVTNGSLAIPSLDPLPELSSDRLEVRRKTLAKAIGRGNRRQGWKPIARRWK